MFGRFKILNYILSPNMKIFFFAITKSVYTYRIDVWGCIFEKYLSLLRTAIHSLLRIFFKKPFHSNTDILYNTFGIQNSKKSHAKQLLTNLYFCKLESVCFNF